MRIGGVRMIINPGAGAVSNGEQATARANIVRWAKEAAKEVSGRVVALRPAGPAEDGRWPFVVELEAKGRRKAYEVQMPGIKNIDGPVTSTPRLYVDGSSWWWEFSFPPVDDFVDEEPDQ